MSVAGTGFPWRTAVKIATREVRSAPAKFFFVIVAVALGVGTLTGVRSFSRAFGAMLLDQARTLMAGDVTVRLQGEPSPQQLTQLADLSQRGVRHTQITETFSMVAAPAAPGAPPSDPVLASLKAVDPAAYPFSGVVATTPPGVLVSLDADSVLASPELLMRLQLQTGQQLSVGGQPFRIAGTVDAEPDRLQEGFSLGPRLMLTRAGLERTGIIQFGSQVQHRLLFQLRPGAPPLAAVETELRQDFPRSRVVDYRESNPTLQEGLDHSTTFLSLISLMALIIGALGVASAMHAHLQMRMDSIATMKVLGARTSQLMRIYGVQTLLLGVGGGVLGVGLSALIERAFPHLLANVLPGLPPIGWSWAPAGEGLLIGVLITLLFTLPTLLGVRRVRPSLLLRRFMSEPRGDLGQRARAGGEKLALAAALFAGVAAIAAGLVDAGWRDSLRIGGWFLGGLAAAVLALALVSWILMSLLRLLTGAWKVSGRVPPSLRHGVANLHRPGSQSRPVLIALGVGVMFTLSVFLLQRSLLTDLMRSTPPGVPDVFLMDIPADQADAVTKLLRSQPGLEHQPELLPTLTARLTSVNGHAPTPAANPAPAARGDGRGEGSGGGRGEGNDRGDGFGGRGFRRGRTYTLTTAAAVPDGIELTQGTWWSGTPPTDQPQAAISEDVARQLGLHPGDSISWIAGERAFTTQVAALYAPDPHRLMSQVAVIVSPGPLAGLPMIVNGGVRIDQSHIPALERLFYQRFPTVTVINLAEIITRVQKVVDQITEVVHFVSLFAILAGAIILAAGVAGTRFRRMREIAVLKTYGATRGRVARIFSTEFLLLGGVAGLAGSLLAIGFTNLVTTRLLKVPFHIDWAPNLIAIAATAAIAVAAGWLACAGILSLRPLDVLRGE